jgi:GlpG protein
MRQVGTLESETAARRFAAWLLAQRIEAHAEQEPSGWVVWVRDEDQLGKAREEFTHFCDHPNDPRYQTAEKSAEAVLREEAARRQQAAGNVVEMRGRWGTPGMPGGRRKAPISMLLIGISAVIALLTWNDTMEVSETAQPLGGVYRALLFVDPADAHTTASGELRSHIDMWASIRRGEIWRLITPIFIHYGPMHIVFNVMMLFSFGTIVEDRRGPVFLLLLVVIVAVLSNAGQATEAMIRDTEQRFGGLSGVCYGLFGYVLTKSRFDDRERYFLSPATTILALGWLVLCILREFPGFSEMLSALPSTANTVHVVGLLTGAAMAYVPLVVKRPA